MNRVRRFAQCPPRCLLACLLALGGCHRKIWISQHPRFYTPELKTIVVAPFRNATGRPAAGRVISGKVAAALAANATYEVLTRSDLAMPTDAAGPPAAADTAALAELLRKRRRAQAILTGTVTQYASAQKSDWRQRPVYQHDRKGRRRLSHYVGYTHVRNEATVDATARLIRVSDGTAIHATAPHAARAAVASEARGDEGLPPELDLDECLASAADKCVAKLLESFAVVRKQISVPRDALRTAAELRDGKWRGGKKFHLTDEKMIVVVNFPAECDRNRFRIVIARRDTGQEAASRNFTWLRHWASRTGKGFVFSPRRVAEGGGGPGRYVARLYSGREAVLEAKFEIEDRNRLYKSNL